jgi:tetratricopeptide (TPR) repeat protein
MDLPYRHRNHEIEELSERFFKNCIPVSWVVNPFRIDYGTDYNCEISINGKVSGINFTVQLKGKETCSKNEFVSISKIKRTTINRWLNRLEPTMIVAFLVDENEAYWMWFENNSVDLTKGYDTFQIKIPRNNKFSKIEWSEISTYVEDIFGRKNFLYEIPCHDDNRNAWDLYFKHDYDKALPLFKDMSINDKNGTVWNALAFCYYQLYHYQDALISVNKALEYNQNKTFLLNKASILTEQGLLQKDKSKLNIAAQIFQTLLKQDNNSYILHYNYSNALKGLDDYQGAKFELIMCLKQNPNYAQAWKNLGSLYSEFGFYDKEIACYNKALTINPNLQEAIFSKGVVLYKVYNQVDQGLLLMLRSTEISNRFEIDFPYCFFWIAEAYIYKQSIELAEKWNEKGINNNPSDLYLLKQKERIEEIKNAR